MFETEQHNGNLKHVSGAYMIDLTIDLEIWPIPPLIFTGGSKSAIFGLIAQQRSILSPVKIRGAICKIFPCYFLATPRT